MMYPTLEQIKFIISLIHIYKQVFRYFPIFLLFFGTIGNLMSCSVFLQRTLRKNPCAIYFLAASIANIIYLATLTSLMLDAWDETLNLMGTISGMCKFTMLIIMISRTLSLWFIVLATIDRYLISSPDQNQRQMNNLKGCYRSIIIVSAFALALWAEAIYCFDANLINTPIKCYTISNACRLYNDITLALMSIIIPSMVMLVFGGLTIRNIHQSRQRMHPSMSVTVAVPTRSRKTEQNFTRMLLTQVFLIIVLNLPQAIFTFYLTMIFEQPKTLMQNVVNGFIFNILLLFPFISCCISFLLYTLSGKIFRQALVRVTKRMINFFLTCHRRHS